MHSNSVINVKIKLSWKRIAKQKNKRMVRWEKIIYKDNWRKYD